jgi:hypothetical protein
MAAAAAPSATTLRTTTAPPASCATARLMLAAGRQHRGGRRYSISFHNFLLSSNVNELAGLSWLVLLCQLHSRHSWQRGPRPNDANMQLTCLLLHVHTLTRSHRHTLTAALLSTSHHALGLAAAGCHSMHAYMHGCMQQYNMRHLQAWHLCYCLQVIAAPVSVPRGQDKERVSTAVVEGWDKDHPGETKKANLKRFRQEVLDEPARCRADCSHWRSLVDANMQEVGRPSFLQASVLVRELGAPTLHLVLRRCT